MANKTINQLTILSDDIDNNDLFIIYDSSAGTTNNFSFQSFKNSLSIPDISTIKGDDYPAQNGPTLMTLQDSIDNIKGNNYPEQNGPTLMTLQNNIDNIPHIGYKIQFVNTPVEQNVFTPMARDIIVPNSGLYIINYQHLISKNNSTTTGTFTSGIIARPSNTTVSVTSSDQMLLGTKGVVNVNNTGGTIMKNFSLQYLDSNYIYNLYFYQTYVSSTTITADQTSNLIYLYPIVYYEDTYASYNHFTNNVTKEKDGIFVIN